MEHIRSLRLSTVAACAVLAAPAAKAGTLTTLYRFAGGLADADAPAAGPAVSKETAVYGDTFGGGKVCEAVVSRPGGCGVLYRIGPDGTKQTLFAFDGKFSGAFPVGPVLFRDKLYGTTGTGSTGDHGLIYSIARDGKNFTVLHRFTGKGGEGPDINSNLLFDTAGDIFGTTVDGGAKGYGVLYE